MIVGCNRCRDRDNGSQSEPCKSCTADGRGVPTNWRRAITQQAARDLLAACEKARQLADRAIDWNLSEVEIDGAMVSTYELAFDFDKAIANAKGADDDS